MDAKLFCRVRPPSASELEEGLKLVLTEGNCSKTVSRFAKFDTVFTPSDGQDAVFSKINPIASQVFMGHNVCLLFYGPEGSGKSFTMTGEVDEKGLLYKVMEDLIRRSKNVAAPKSLSVSLLEVRQELTKDLLVKNPRRLEIKNGKVMGLSTLPIQGVDQMWKLLESSPRDSSSSSHRLVRVTVQGTRSKAVGSLRTNATNHLWFVDMAGSQFDGGARGLAKSFTALEDVLSASASSDRCKIPYRNSQLTHLLFEDCSKVGMIFTVSPTCLDFNDSLCSFNLARRITECLSKKKKKTMKGPLTRYRELRRDMKTFSCDKKYNPREPHDPLGYLYDGILTAATQALFRHTEYFSRNSPRFVNGCNVLATTVQNRAADLALLMISEESPYSKRKWYEGAGGMFAMTRFLVPAVITASIMFHNHLSEREKSYKQRDDYLKISESVKDIEGTVAELKVNEAVKSILSK